MKTALLIAGFIIFTSWMDNPKKIAGTYKYRIYGLYYVSLELKKNNTYRYTISDHLFGEGTRMGNWSLNQDTIVLDNFPSINADHFTFSERFDETLRSASFKFKVQDDSGKAITGAMITINDTIVKYLESKNGEWLIEKIKVSKIRCTDLSIDSVVMIDNNSNTLIATVHRYPTTQTLMYTKWKRKKRTLMPYNKDNILLEDYKLSK